MIAVYARQSLDKKDSLSIETQIELCKAEEEKDAPCKVYIDRGYSGKNTDRPEFSNMMHDIRSGIIEKVTVYKLDRLSRSLLDFAEMVEVFKKYGVAFNSAREKFDTSTPIGNAMLSIIMVFAQLERETTQVRVRDSFRARSEKGTYDAKAPYGYKKAKATILGKPVSTIEINDETVDIVRKIYETYAYSNDSLGTIARDLNQRKVPSPAGTEWDSGKLSRIMANPIYVRADTDVYRYYKATGANITNPVDDYIGTNGCVTYGNWDRMRRKFEQWDKLSISIGLHEGIIDSGTFLQVQWKLNNNSQIKNSGQGKHTWLTGIVKCAYCGYAYKVNFTSGKQPYFVCSGRSNYGTCTDSHQWAVADVEKAIETEILGYVKRGRDIQAEEKKQEDVQIESLKIEIVRIDEQIGNLISALASGSETTIKYVNQRIESLESEKSKLTMEMQSKQFKSGANQPQYKFKDIDTLWGDMPLEEKSDIAKTLINKVRLYQDKIEISWKYNVFE